MGKIVVLSGQWSVGKSTWILQAIAEAQKQGIKCLFCDVEFSYDTDYAAALGVDNSKLGLIRERTAEDVLEKLEEEIEKNKFKLFVIDSIGALSSRIEIEKPSGEKTIAQQASLVSRFIRKVVPNLALNGSTLICLSHEFTDLMSGKILASGGAKLFYHASQHIRLKAKSGVSLKQGENFVGKVIVAEIKKDKIKGNEKKEIEGRLLFGRGFAPEADRFEEELLSGSITKQGNTYFRNGEKLAVGKMKAIETLRTLV